MTRLFTAARLWLVGRERAQMLLFMVPIVTVTFVAAVIGIDASVWHSERRTAQKDADVAAFAGGQELFNRTNAADIASRADQAAFDWGTRNGIGSSVFTNSTPNTITSCFGSPSFDGLPDGVVVDLSAKGATLFSSIWKSLVPDVGAHAKVCIGSPPDAEGVLPFGVPIQTSQCFDPDGTPLFGATCDLEVRAPNGQSGETGVLRLYNDGSLECSASNVGNNNPTLLVEVINGANTTCATAAANANANNCQLYNSDHIGTCVWSDTGNRAGTVIDGLQTRLAREGSTSAPYNCDNLYPDGFFGAAMVHDKVDQWWEAVYPLGADIHSITPGPAITFAKRTCTAPRLVVIVLIDQFAAQGQGPYLIRGFAGFFITGCRDSDNNFNQRCVTNQSFNNGCGGGGCPNPTNEPKLKNTGQLKMEGMFINYVDIGRRGGPLNRFGRSQLFLVD